MESETLSTEGVGTPRKTVLSLLEDGDLLLVQDGNHGGNYPAQSDFVEFGGIPLITGADIEKGLIDISGSKQITTEKASQLRVGIAQEGDLLLTHKGTMGKTAVIPAIDAPFIVVNPQITIYRVNPKGSIDTRFLKYFFDSPGFQEYLNRISSTSTVSTLSITNQKHLEIPCPSIEDQGRISNLLGILDDKIKLNRKTNETLEGIAKALFKSWFVDFDPVRAKADGRPTGLPDEISELFPDSFEESELGEIPSGWKFVPLTEMIQVDPKRLLSKGSLSPYLEMKGVPTSGHSAEGVYNREFTSGTKFQNGDTLLARITPCLENGKTAMVDFLEGSQIGWGSTEFIVLCGIRPEHNSFAYYLSRSNDFREHAIRNMVGSSGRQRVPSDSLKDFLFPEASMSIFNTFSSLADSLLERIANASRESRTLSGLRDALLPRLISGELRVPAAEKMLEEAGI